MKWAVVALNHRSMEEAKRLKALCTDAEVDLYTIEKYRTDEAISEGVKPLSGGLRKYNEVLFRDYKVIIYVMAMGIIVRDIAPYMKHKSLDPAVLCLSVDGAHIIPVLSGHLGGANALAMSIGERIGALPIITTASDLLGKTAVDMIAKAQDLVITSYKGAKDVTAMLINEEKVAIVCEEVKSTDGSKVAPLNEVNGKEPLRSIPEWAKGLIYIGYKKKIESRARLVRLLPKRLVIGIGARRDTPFEKINDFVTRVFNQHNLDVKAVCAIASIDIKGDEAGIISLGERLKVPFTTYTSQELLEVVEGFDQSEFVKKITGVGAVAMPSGYLASKKGRCLVSKVAEEGMTLCVWEVPNN